MGDPALATDDPVLALLVGTLIYVIFSVVFFLILDTTSSLNSILAPELLVNVWLTVGAILGVADLIVLVGFLSNIFSEF